MDDLPTHFCPLVFPTSEEDKITQYHKYINFLLKSTFFTILFAYIKKKS